MHSIRMRTGLFPTAPEGDLERCNGQPGSAVAAWLRAALAERGIAAGEPIQEDYGWGFWLDDPATIWVAVSYAEDDPAEMPVWYVSVTHETPFFAPRQWFRRGAGKLIVEYTFRAIVEVIRARDGVRLEEIEPRSY